MPKKSTTKRRSARNTLRLPDLDHSKTSVLQSLGSMASKRTYAFAINDFIAWYCSEPRLAFGRTVVLRYRYDLEARRLAPATINLRLAAVRRLAYEAADNGLLSPDLAASVRRVKGAKAWYPPWQLAHLRSRAQASRRSQPRPSEGEKRSRNSGPSPGVRPAACRVDQSKANAPPAARRSLGHC